VESPTVYSQKHWVRRRLSVKELYPVLDFTKGLLTGDPSGVALREVTFPGKACAQVVEDIRQGFRCHALKRKSFEESNTQRTGPKRVKWKLDLQDKESRPEDTPKPLTMLVDTVTVKAAKSECSGLFMER
jgi:hypothetical protein